MNGDNIVWGTFVFVFSALASTAAILERAITGQGGD